MTRYAIVVPTFGRPDDLTRCLDALGAQRRPFDEIVVATRTDDPVSASVAKASETRCTVLELEDKGVLAAMAAGARASSADVVCFTDDDAVAPPDWLERLDAALDGDARVGGAGGRDAIVVNGTATAAQSHTSGVGRVTWYGRHVGRHHLGAGGARDVAFLKGVNAAYRRRALGLPHGLRGAGAEAHYEIAVGRYARSQGYRLVYDPAITVEHHPAPRRGGDQRSAPSPAAISDASYNLVVAVGGFRGLARVAYATLVGDRGAPGLGRALLAVLRGDRATARRLGPSVRGSLAGGWALVRGRGVTYETFA
ncbi:MAG TPA: glycosyltransferase family A protein [Acidimicrobiales bacterium]|nr:glycosyltransferase family A protein [Acidimicrobiales bacterium]